MQLSIKIYIFILAAISISFSLLWFDPSSLHLLTLPLFILLMILGEAYKIPVILYDSKEYVKISWSLVVSISVLAGSGITDAIIVNLIGGIICSFYPKRLPLIKVFYNIFSYLSSMTITYLFYKSLKEVDILSGSSYLFELLLIPVIYLIVNCTINLVLLKLVTKKNFIQLVNNMIMPHLHHFILFSFIGGIQGYFYKENGIFAFIPTSILIGIVLYSFKNNAHYANERIMELENSNKNMEKLAEALDQTLDEFIMTLTATIDARDPYTYGHSLQVSNYAVALATELNLNKEEIETIRIAGLLHDIGKISIPEEILFKDGKLTSEEYEIMKKHPVIGEEILSDIPRLSNVAKLVGMHHERYNGSGYPESLVTNQIPLGAHILGVADTLDAILSSRSYKKERTVEEAMTEFNRCRGTHFHPTVVDALFKLRTRAGDEAFLNSATLIDSSLIKGKIKTNRGYLYNNINKKQNLILTRAQ